MTLSISSVIIIAMLAPFAVLILVARIRVYRRRIAAKAAEKQAAGKPVADKTKNHSEVRFEAKAEPTSGLLLRHFTRPQRAYLRNQFPSARFGFYFCAYILTIAISIGPLPQQVHQVKVSAPSLQVWLSYTGQLNVTYFVAALLGAFASIFAVVHFQTPTGAIFFRTRPLSHRFLFWGCTAFALASLLAAILAAILFSIVLLLLTYGPVRTQIPSVTGLIQPVFASGLSMLITAALVFSAVTSLAFIPRGLNANGKIKFLFPVIGRGDRRLNYAS